MFEPGFGAETVLKPCCRIPCRLFHNTKEKLSICPSVILIFLEPVYLDSHKRTHRFPSSSVYQYHKVTNECLKFVFVKLVPIISEWRRNKMITVESKRQNIDFQMSVWGLKIYNVAFNCFTQMLLWTENIDN